MISKNRQLNGDSVIPAWSADLYTVIPAGSAGIQMPWKGSHIPVAWIPALPLPVRRRFLNLTAAN
ncbi:MAG: hypothetical protein ACXWTL_08985 [Methylobacter sp.]